MPSKASSAPIARCVSFDFDNTLLLSEHTKMKTMEEIVSKYDGGLEVLESVPRDSRVAPPGVKVTRYTIFDATNYIPSAVFLNTMSFKPGTIRSTMQHVHVLTLH